MNNLQNILLTLVNLYLFIYKMITISMIVLKKIQHPAIFTRVLEVNVFGVP